jgi:hypothetical protein
MISIICDIVLTQGDLQAQRGNLNAHISVGQDQSSKPHSQSMKTELIANFVSALQPRKNP